MDLPEFTERFLTGDEQVIDLDPGLDRWPHIVVRNGPYVAVLQLQGHASHLAIDVHPFVEGRDARAGAFGMEAGHRLAFLDVTGGTSHSWPATRMVTVLVGEQTDAHGGAQ